MSKTITESGMEFIADNTFHIEKSPKFEDLWCDSIQKALSNKICESVCLSKIWKPEINVMNGETAASRSLIVEEKKKGTA